MVFAMDWNIHTHTPRCRHARGSEREYIESAIQAGIRTLGFSDHAPILFPGDYYSTMRMYPDEMAGYCDTLLSLREEYRGRIDIRIGLEMEYYPGLFAATIDFLSTFPLDYLILGQHYLYDEIGSAYVARGTGDPSLLCRYVDQCCAGLETGRFTYLAHPDVFLFTGDPSVYRREMRRLCRKARETGTPLELNLLGIEKSRHYPCEAFFSIAGEEGCIAVLGCDAHDPEALQSRQAEQIARELSAHCSMLLAESVPLRPPFPEKAKSFPNLPPFPSSVS